MSAPSLRHAPQFSRCLAMLLLLGGALAGTAACDSKDEAVPSAKPSGPAVDTKALASALEAVNSVDSDMKHQIVAKALEELEAKRLNKDLVEALRVMNEAPPDRRMVMLAKAFSEQISLANEVCAGSARELFIESAQIAPDQRSALIFDACKFEARKLVTRAELNGADPMTAWLAHMIQAELASHGELAAGELTLLKMLATTPTG